jgi:hypothetical protein
MEGGIERIEKDEEGKIVGGIEEGRDLGMG